MKDVLTFIRLMNTHMKVNGPQRSINQRDARATRINDSKEELSLWADRNVEAERNGAAPKSATAISRASAHTDLYRSEMSLKARANSLLCLIEHQSGNVNLMIKKGTRPQGGN